MNDLAELLVLMADRVSLAGQWLDHGKPEQARLSLTQIHDELLELAGLVREGDQ